MITKRRFLRNGLAYLVLVCCSGCCESSIQAEKSSPSGKRIAAAAVVNCGASSNYATVVTVSDLKDASSQSAVVMNAEGDQSIGIEWKDDNTLVVSLSASTLGHDFVDRKIGVQNHDVNGVHIDYQILR